MSRFTVVAVTPNEEVALHIENQLIKPNLKGFYNIATENSGTAPAVYTVPVSQYSLSGEFIKTYDSLTDAGYALGGRASPILAAASGILTTSYGFMWRKNLTGTTKNIEPLPEGYITSLDKGIFWVSGTYTIKKWTCKGEYLGEWNSLEQASIDNGLRRLTLMNHLNKGVEICGGFVYTMDDEEFKPPKHIRNRGVVKYSLSGEKVSVYVDISEAANDIGCKWITIYAAINRSQGTNRSNGFLWEYEGEELKQDCKLSRVKSMLVMPKDSITPILFNSIKDLCNYYNISRKVLTTYTNKRTTLSKLGFEIEYL